MYLRSEVEGREAWVDAFKASWMDVELSDREKALCTYAAKLTREPARMNAGDIEPLRAAGLDDLGIVHLAHVVGFFAYANRIADGLGCDLEAGMAPRAEEGT